MSNSQPTAHTRLLALLGDPVSHSFSPVLHNSVFRALGLDALYLALRCTAADCPSLLAGIARSGGAGNITIPHKQVAAAALDRPSEAVSRTGACNTYWLEDGRVCGDNTDVQGFVGAVRLAFGDVTGSRVLVLGAGGAARAVLMGLDDLRADYVRVMARSAGRAEQLASILDGSRTRFAAGQADLADYDLVVNTTPLGLYDTDPMPCPVSELAPDTRVFDLVYRVTGTPWVQSARAAGLAAADGKEMLIQQAAASFTRWWRREAPIEQMRLALESPAA